MKQVLMLFTLLLCNTKSLNMEQKLFSSSIKGVNLPPIIHGDENAEDDTRFVDPHSIQFILRTQEKAWNKPKPIKNRLKPKGRLWKKKPKPADSFLYDLMKEWSETPQEQLPSEAEILVQLLTTDTFLDKLIAPNQGQKNKAAN